MLNITTVDLSKEGTLEELPAEALEACLVSFAEICARPDCRRCRMTEKFLAEAGRRFRKLEEVEEKMAAALEEAKKERKMAAIYHRALGMATNSFSYDPAKSFRNFVERAKEEAG